MLSHRLCVLALLFGCPTNSNSNLMLANAEENHQAEATLLTEESLLQTMKEAQDFLKEFQMMNINSISVEMNLIKDQIHQIEIQNQQVEELVQQIKHDKTFAFKQQVNHFKDRLQEKHQQVLNLMSGGGDTSRTTKEAITTDDDATAKVDYVPIKALKKKFETRKVMSESESFLVAWMDTLIGEELANYRNKIFKSKEDGEEEEIDDKEEEEGCLSMNEAVQKVQAAVTEFAQDGIGLIDHIQGGTIVHSMTSRTYEPPAKLSELLGYVWWRKYIPEDWEGMLPEGWEDWDTSIPSMFYHSLKIGGAKVSPPEAVMQTKTVPGSCWPMEGNRGKFTIRLPYPIFVDTFSVDHVSSPIVPKDVRDTAPKKLKVTGYPPCGGSDHCTALGFDIYDPMDIGFINFDRNGASVQTFDSVFAQAAHVDIDIDEEEPEIGDDYSNDPGLLGLDSEGDGEEQGCSAGATACSSPPVVAFAGITVQVLENWGNPDYTCIYRFRLHGNPDSSS